MHLRESCLERGAGAHAATSTGRCTVVGTVVGSGLRPVLAVDQDVTSGADLSRGALKNTGGHVADARGTDNAHGMATHVDLPRDINDTPLAKSELAPGVGSLAVDELGVRVDGRPGARCAVCKRDPNRLSSRNGSSDRGLDGIDPGACNAPDHKDQIFTRLVDELVLVRTIVTEPRVPVGECGVDAESSNTQGSEFAGIGSGQGRGAFPVSGVSSLEVSCYQIQRRSYSAWTWSCLRAWLWKAEWMWPTLAAYAWPIARVASTKDFIV